MMRGYGYYGPMAGGGHFLGGFLAFLFGIAVIAGIVLLVVWLVRKSSHQHPQAPVTAAPQPPVMPAPQPPVMPTSGHEEAIAIAKRRFANGEITKDQYEEIVQTLGG